MQIQKKGAKKVVRKAFILIVSICVLLFTACGQRLVNSEEILFPQEPSVESENSILTEGGDDLPAAEPSTAASAVSENEQSTKEANSPEKPTVADRVLPMETDIEEAATAPKQPSQSPSAPIQKPEQNQPVQDPMQNPDTTPVPEPVPEPAASGNIYSVTDAMQIGNEYAVSKYGVYIESSLTRSNAGYYPGTADPVSWFAANGGQDALNAAVCSNVDATFANLAARDGADVVSAYASFNCDVRYNAAADEYIIVILYG